MGRHAVERAVSDGSGERYMHGDLAPQRGLVGLDRVRPPMTTTPFKQLAILFDKLEHTSSSTSMVTMLAHALPQLSAAEMRMTAYLLSGKVGPSFSTPELGIAEALAARAIAEASAQPMERVTRLISRAGDAGQVAESLLARPAGRLSIAQVFEALRAIAYTQGMGSQQAKVKTLASLLNRAAGLEAKYIVRSVLGTHRIGVAESTFLAGLAQAFGDKKDKATLEHAYNVLSDLGEVAYRAARSGVVSLRRLKPVPGIPVRMMLAGRIEDLDEVPLHLPGELFVEYKYDGERVQIHRDARGQMRAFSRRLEDITHQYPEVIAGVHAHLKAKTAIVEGEVAAIDLRTGQLKPFQVLMRRKRRYDVARYQREVPVRFFAFDLLLLDGKSLLSTPLAERRARLTSRLTAAESVRIARFIRTQDMTQVERYFHEAVEQGAEGVVIKGADSPYQAGHRGWHWIKFKKEYETELADTFDVVIVGALYGRGMRAGSFGSVLVAAFDPKTNRYYSFTKVGAGFNEQMLKRLPRLLKPQVISAKHRLVETRMKMDVWFEPAKVIEIMGADLSVSPVHTVARDILKKGGIALRFPRFLRLREDKAPEQATTVREIWQMYRTRQQTALR
jgi:DNA ligase 1